MSDHADEWARHLDEALVDLGIQPAVAQRLAAESVEEARASGVAPRDLFGPAVLYARQLQGALLPAESTGSPTASAPGRTLLQLRGVTKRYGRRSVLRGVDLTVRAGEVAAIVGSNGSGKSTLLRICAGLTRASSGEVRRAGRVGYVPQDGGLAELLTAHEHFMLFGALQGMSAGRAVCTGEQLASRLAWRPTRDVLVQHLSGGTRQKLNVVLGEIHRPDLLLLDEPYQGFDHGSYVDFWHQVYGWRDAGAGVVVVTHLMHELDRADHVVELTTGAGE